MSITTAQIRGARGLLDWSQAELSRRTGISTTSIGNIESGNTQARESTLAVIRKSLEAGGIEFLPNSGVRMKDQMVITLEGDGALETLLDDIYTTLYKTGGEVLAYGVEERLDKASPEYQKVMDHLDRLHKANITERLIIREGDNNFMAPKEYYRWISKDFFSPYPFYIYGDKLALLNWEPSLNIIVITNSLFAESFHKVFNFLWTNAETPRAAKDK